MRHNYRILYAENGSHGVKLARQHIPDVIISDVMMPEMDGFEVCHQLKEDRNTSHIPIILLTAKAAREDRLTGLRTGADAYLTKPFDREELLLRLANMAAWSERLRENLKQGSVYQDVVERKQGEFLKELGAILREKLSDENYGTEQLCLDIAMSRTQLHRKLKALTGTSTGAYIRRFRLNEANQLLQETNMAIGEIAMHVGFKDFSHFTRSFTKVFGCTPSDAREKMIKK